MELLEFITSEIGKKILIFNNYKFSFAQESQCGKTRWRYAKKTCTAKIYTISTNLQRGMLYIKTVNFCHIVVTIFLFDR